MTISLRGVTPGALIDAPPDYTESFTEWVFDLPDGVHLEQSGTIAQLFGSGTDRGESLVYFRFSQPLRLVVREGGIAFEKV